MAAAAASSSAELQRVIEELFRDHVFTNFDAFYWSNLKIDRSLGDVHRHEKRRFAQVGFPTIMKYRHGRELDVLTRSQPWLNRLSSPSTRFAALAAFQEDPAYNMGVLELFTKLKYVEEQGARIAQHGPRVWIYYEVYLLLAPKKVEAKLSMPEGNKPYLEINKPCDSYDNPWTTKDVNVSSEMDLLKEMFADSWVDFVSRQA